MDGFGRLASTLLSKQQENEDASESLGQAMPLPNAGFGSVRYVKVYATYLTAMSDIGDISNDVTGRVVSSTG